MLMAVSAAAALAGERSIVALKDMSSVEIRSAGFTLPRKGSLHIVALGGGGDYGWTYKSDRMFAYAWIINAGTRELVWKMDRRNTSRSGDDRKFDDNLSLDAGSYEVYFAATTFDYHTAFTHFTNIDVDHRNTPLFEHHKGKDNFFSFFTDWWSEDFQDSWDKRSKHWGIEIFADEALAGSLTRFTPPLAMSDVLLKITRPGDESVSRTGFTLAEPATLHLYCLGEGKGDNAMADYGWIVSLPDRRRVWEMNWRNIKAAGGAKKNIMVNEDVRFDKGSYVLYWITDDSHSNTNWNDAPPFDPLNYGVTVVGKDEHARNAFSRFAYEEDKNIIVQITRVGNDERKSAGFTLKEPARVRVYALGERGLSRRELADYGSITNAKTRQKVWSMDVDRCSHAGGASKNCYIDEVISLPKGSYTVTYTTDDSHAYGDWNSDPPFDQEHYGITVMGAGEGFSQSIVGTYTEERDKNIIAQIIHVRDDANKTERFTLDRTTKVRVYALGEGQGRQMYDYGWIEDARSGNVVWEMTYAMTFYAGGGRKNRMVNVSIILEKGEYLLHYKSDDSHSYGDWNTDPPDDREYWGITLYKDDGTIPAERPPDTPIPPDPDDE